MLPPRVFSFIKGLLALVLFTIILTTITLYSTPKQTLANWVPLAISEGSAEMMLLRFKQKHSFCQSQALKTALKRIATSIQTTNSSIRYSVEITKSESLNKKILSLPGGVILIGDELLNNSLTQQELTAMIAHEMAHVELKHAEKAYLNQLSQLSIIKNILLLFFNSGEVVNRMTSGLTESLVFRKYNLNEEIEADTYAVNLLAAKNLPSQALVSALQKLQAFTNQAQAKSLQVRLNTIATNISKNSAVSTNKSKSLEIISPKIWTAINQLCSN